MTEGPITRYRALRQAGELQPDPVQELAVEKLQSLHHALNHYSPETGASGWKERLGLARRRRAEPPQGLYLYGGVGRGKSMLMDLFFAGAPVGAKRRVHFHEFMLEVHDRLHRKRQAGGATDTMIPDLAARLAEEAWLLCFDEFHVTNIADAMILGRLFEALFEHGVVVVATSNWPPDRLYEGGLQRDRFLPFIEIIKHRLDVLHLEGSRDFRRQRIRDIDAYLSPLGPAADRRLKDAFARLTDDAPGEAQEVEVKGRTIPVRRAAKGVACFTFDDLCAKPLGAVDYLAIAECYHTIILAGVPALNAAKHNEARRFMTLIDALYEKRRNLIMAAERQPDRLYPDGDGSFEFQRTASRLLEMGSQDYRQAG